MFNKLKIFYARLEIFFFFYNLFLQFTAQSHLGKMWDLGFVPYRHEALVFIQSLLVGSNEQASILDPARLEASLLLQLWADHVASVSQQLHLCITRS